MIISKYFLFVVISKLYIMVKIPLITFMYLLYYGTGSLSDGLHYNTQPVTVWAGAIKALVWAATGLI